MTGIGEFFQTNSFLHRIDIRTKSACFVVVLVLAFLFNNPLYEMFPIFFLLMLFKASKVSLQGVARILTFLIPIFVIIAGMTSFSSDPEGFSLPTARRVLFYLFPNNVAPLSVGGILLGLTLISRMLTMILSSMLLSYTTPTDDFLVVMHQLRIPYKIGFVVTTAVRFIPTMEQKARMVLDAQRSRGADLEESNVVRKIAAYSSVMIPMIVDSIRMSENLAVAMINRGFGSGIRYTFLDHRDMSLRDYVMVAGAIVLLALGVLLRTNGHGQL